MRKYERISTDPIFTGLSSMTVPPTPKLVYFIKLWNYIVLSKGMLSAYNPDTIPQRQNNYSLFPVYIIPLWIRARCWHMNLHLSTLLWHFIVTWPKNFKLLTPLETATKGMCGILLLQKGMDVFLWQFTARHSEGQNYEIQEKATNLCWWKLV